MAWTYDSRVAEGGEMVQEDSDERACVHARVPSRVAGLARVRDRAHVRVNEKVRAARTCDSGVGEARRHEGCRCCESGVPRVRSSCGMWTSRNFVIQTCHVIMVGGVRRSYHIPRAYNLCLLYVSCCTYIVYPDTYASY